MGETLYPKPPKLVNKNKPWRVEYDLAYDGAAFQWTGYYRTKFSAKVFAFFEYHIISYGGSAVLFKNE